MDSSKLVYYSYRWKQSAGDDALHKPRGVEEFHRSLRASHTSPAFCSFRMEIRNMFSGLPMKRNTILSVRWRI